MNKISPHRIENAVACIASEVSDRLRESSKPILDERDLWAELSCCILSSQVPYELAKAAAERIRETSVLCDSTYFDPGKLRARLLGLLLTPLPLNGSHRRYRFPVRGASQIAAACYTVHQAFGSLRELLNSQSDPRQARAWMAANVPGIGPNKPACSYGTWLSPTTCGHRSARPPVYDYH